MQKAKSNLNFKKIMSSIISVLIIMASISLLVTGCNKENVEKKGKDETKDIKDMKEVKVLLDWVPNTNHTGLYVAVEKGFYKEEGLNVTIIQPPEGGGPELIAAEQGQFGISYQEQITYARTTKNPLPVKAIAAIIQHNTSGFASPLEKNIKTPKDFEGKKYGGWGSPMEEAMLKGIMEKNGADFSKLQIVNIGTADFFTSVQRDVDFSWIYYGWDGVAAKIKDFSINFIKLQDVDPILDFYTPVIITNENILKNDPDMVEKFMKATSRGYEYAIENPEDAVKLLLKHAPEIDEKLAIESQKYLAGEYKSDAKRWGEMKLEIWERYGNWMYEKGLIESKLSAEEAFTNEFLPK